MYNNVDLRIFIHYPKHLIRSFHKPMFRSKLGFETTSGDLRNFWSRLLRITIGKVSVLRKRSGSNVGCDEKLVDDDAKLQEYLIKRIKCIPAYWRRYDLPQKNCQSKTDLQNAYTFIEDYKPILNSYPAPCVQMEVSSKYDREEQNERDGPSILFKYENTDYEEIQNTQDFDLESFVSGIGGFIGIFLGYSILQIPDLIASLTSFIGRLRRNNNAGDIQKSY